MRLATWNARKGAFDRKVPLLESLKIDIAVVPEIAAPRQQSENLLWFGDNPKQGVAVLASEAYKLQRLPELPDAPKFVVPIRVSGPQCFILFAVWTLEKQPMRYVRAAVTAIDIYAELFSEAPVVMLGDFNSNSIWDKDHPKHLCHSSMVCRLQDLGLVSAYHYARGHAHGKEMENTFYLYGHENRGYHIDYCFLPNSWAARIQSVKIGSFADWRKYSDHRPLVVSIHDEP